MMAIHLLRPQHTAVESDWFIENLILKDSLGLMHGIPQPDDDDDLCGVSIAQKRPLVYLALDLLLHIDHARVAPTKFRRQYPCYPADILFITEWFKSAQIKTRIAEQSLGRGWKLPTEHFHFIAGERVDLFDAPTLEELSEIIEENSIDLLVLDSDPMRFRGTEKAWHKAITSLQDSVSTVLDISFHADAGPYDFSLDVDLAPDGIESITQPCGHTTTLATDQNEKKESMTKWEK